MTSVPTVQFDGSAVVIRSCPAPDGTTGRLRIAAGGRLTPKPNWASTPRPRPPMDDVHLIAIADAVGVMA